MGVEAAVIGGLAVSVIGAFEAKDAMKKQAAAQEDAQDEQTARQQNQDMEKRRQELRQERIRRAQIMQASENQGTSESSSEAVSLGNLSQNNAISEGGRQGGQAAAASINSNMQKAAGYGQDAQVAGGFAQIGMQVAQSNGGINSLFQSSQKVSAPSQINQTNLYDNI